MKTGNIEIRELTESELDDVLALYGHLHASDEPLPERSQVELVWRAFRGNPRLKCFGVFAGGVLVSSCSLAIVPNLTHGCRPYAVIENVVTHADERKRGYGRAVLEHALEHAWRQGCHKVMLATGRKNEETFRFYESVGFDRHAKQVFVARPGKARRPHP